MTRRKWARIEEALAAALHSMKKDDILIVSGEDPVLYVQFYCTGSTICAEAADPAFQGAPDLDPIQKGRLEALGYVAPEPEISNYNHMMESSDHKELARSSVGALETFGANPRHLVYTSPSGTEFGGLAFSGIHPTVSASQRP